MSNNLHLQIMFKRLDGFARFVKTWLRGHSTPCSFLGEL
jgi:hypothetical protein